MKKYLIRIKYFLKDIIVNLKYIHKKKISIESRNNRIFIFLAADYANMGDIAITYAQKNFLKELMPKYDIIEIPISKTLEVIPFLKKNINNDDIITIIGGGNLTNRYESIEEKRRMVIKNFKNNKIISFPQTIEFTKDEQGQESLRRSKNIYSKHKQLTIFARENKSYEIMKELFKNNRVLLAPDIVMSLKNNIKLGENKREKIGLCLRDDKEKLLKIDVNEYIKEHFGRENIEYISTHIGDGNLNYEKKYETLFNLLQRIKNVKVFITDRLHGMIFCYITETPCIVFDNDNHKIKESYNKWLKDCSYIKLLEENDVEKLDSIISDLKYIKEKDVNLKEQFKNLEDTILIVK